MKRMTVSEKQEALQNFMDNNYISDKYFAKCDEIRGQTFAIASKGENGTVNVHTRYMTYDEFNSYLFGWKDAKADKFKN